MYLFICACLGLLLNVAIIGAEIKEFSDFTEEDTRRGNLAELYLLRDAKMMQHVSDQMILYRKQGTLNKAISDYNSLNPEDVKEVNGHDTAYARGRVGDRNVILYSGMGVFPQITITKFVQGNDNKYYSFTKGFWYMNGP